jgi:hypothetical protein
MRPLRVLALLLCASTLALAASGCGSTKSYSGTKPTTWAATVCGALGDWAQGLKADSTRLSSDLSGTTDLKVVKTKFVAFLEDAERSTGTMLTRVKGAGPPAVKDGAAIQQQLVSGFEGAQASFTRAVAKAKNLSTTDPQAFSTGVQALGGDVQKELTATGQKFNDLGNKYGDKSLNKATSNEPACTNISGASG